MIIKYEKIISELEVSRPSAPLKWIIKTVPAWQPLCPHAGPVLSQNIWLTAGREEGVRLRYLKEKGGGPSTPLFLVLRLSFLLGQNWIILN